VPIDTRTASVTRTDNHLHVRPVALLRYRDFRRLITAQVTAQTFDAAASVMLASLVLFGSSDGPTVAKLTALVGSSAAPLVVAGPLGGFLADHFTRRLILGVGQLGRAVLVATGAAGIALGHDEIAIAAWGLGLCVARVLYTTRAATIRHLVRRHELVAADALSLTLSSVAGATGAATGAGLSLLGTAGLLPVVAAHAASAAMFMSISASLGGGREHVAAHWKTVLQHLRAPKIRYALLATSGHRFWFGTMFASAALIGDAWSNGGPAGYVTVLAATGAGAFAGNLTAETANERIPRRVLTVAVYTLSCLGAAVTALADLPAVHIGSLFVIMFLFQNLRVCTDATVQSNATSGAGGREFAAYDVSYNLSFLGGILCGLSAFSSLGGRTVLVSSAGAFAVLAIVLARMNRNEPTVTESTTVDNEPSNDQRLLFPTRFALAARATESRPIASSTVTTKTSSGASSFVRTPPAST
jgi:MFS family permease